jgi:hypothetical protein
MVKKRRWSDVEEEMVKKWRCKKVKTRQGEAVKNQ